MNSGDTAATQAVSAQLQPASGAAGGAACQAASEAGFEPAFEPEFEQAFRRIYEQDIAFNRLLGLQLGTISPTGVVHAHLSMQPQLVGHALYNRIHGGVISAALDALGSAAVMAALAAKHMDEPVPLRLQRFAKLGTIDLRIDYLRPGIGERFELQAECLRVGSRVGTARMSFCAADGTLLSVGTAAYIVS